MKVGAIVLFVLSGVAALMAIMNVFVSAPDQATDIENPVPQDYAESIGYGFGYVLVPLVLLVVGMVLWQKR